MAPGFGMDERLLDARLADGTREAIAGEASSQGNVLRFYVAYWARLAQGDFGTSLSLGRPVKELLAERAPITFRSAAAGLLLAWLAAAGAIAALEIGRRRMFETLAGIATGALLSLPAALVAVLCVYAGTGPSIAIALILLPRIFRYIRGQVAQASCAPHVLAAHAMGIHRPRVLILYIAAPILPDLAALAAVSVSMAIGAAVPVEALSSSPGVGHLVWQAALSRDIPVLVNVTLLIAAVTAGANLLAELVRSPEAAEA
jgi:peptide/nickel transport system permease protein